MGKLYSWGNNAEGTAGNDYAARFLTPTQTVSEGDWDDIQVGESFAIALKDGKLYSWGNGANSRTGQGNTTTLLVPTQIGSATNWESVSAGRTHCVAIKTDGTLWSWGDNGLGKTGQGTTSFTTTTPTQIGTDTDWKSVSVASGHSLALKDNGTLWSWGAAANGKLGNGTTTPNVTSPTQIGVATDWSKIAAGATHSLAIKTDGTLWAWGANGSSQLGTGNTTQYTSPTQIGSDTNWLDISADKNLNNYCSIALKTTGTLWAWGSNSSGQTGLGTTSGTQTTPAQVGSATDWEKICAGYLTCVAIKGGKLYGWGAAISSFPNSDSEVPSSGDGTGLQRTSPVEIDSSATWSTVSVHNQAFCIKEGNLYFWGFNSFGISGDNKLNYTTSPAQVGSATDWDQIAQGNHYHTLALRDGKLFAAGSQRNGVAGNNVDSIVRQYSFTQTGTDTTWTQISTSGYSSNDASAHSLGVKGGELYGWGTNSSYQTGASGTTSKLTPIKIGSNTDWDMVSTGDSFSVGLRDGKLFSWGANANGKTGQGTTSGNTATPTQIGIDTDWSFVDAGSAFVLAIKNDGTLWAWGANANGQLGDSSTTERTAPVQVGAATDWITVSAGDIHSLGINSDGKLYSWGSRSNGRLGDGNTSSNTTSPTQVGSSTDWSKVSAGYQYSLALKTTGTIWGWGANATGQIGDSSTTQRTSPVQIGSGSNWTDITAINATSFAIETSNIAPTNTAAPALSGTASVGETLTTTDGIWTGTPTPTYTYQWQVSDNGTSGWSDISGATAASFTVTASQSRKYLRAKVTATNDGGTVDAFSSSSSKIAPGIPTEGSIWHSARINLDIPTEGVVWWPNPEE